MKTTCKKSWPVNILQVSNFTFDPHFKVEGDHHIETAIHVYLLYIGPWAWNSHHE